MSRTGVVVTTIGGGNFLQDYCREIKAEELRQKVSIYVVPDIKMPVGLYYEVLKYKDMGFDVRFLDMASQERLELEVGLSNLIPYNSDNRRNLGYLCALIDNCEVIISVDDDNYPQPDTRYYKNHGMVGQDCSLRVRSVKNKWYNVLADLELPHIYPRGFPYRHRHESCFFHETEARQKVMMNVGLWIGDPDLDAITWVNGGAKATKHNGKSFLLGQDTWTPISSQNTSLHRDVMVAYYFLPMNTTVRGLEMDRYGDMFSGFFAQACVKHMGHGIRVGTPVVEHRRNTHHHWDDVRKELTCIGMVDDLMEWLVEAKLEGNTYGEAYLSLAEKMEDIVESFSGSVWTVDAKAYFHRAAYCMRKWVKACESVNKQRKEEDHASVSGSEEVPVV